jgi:hypothetical protein
MPQLTLYAPDITCDHCIATIERTVQACADARFIGGNVEGKRFSVEILRGAVLDDLAIALAAEGYPLGDAVESEGQPAPARTNVPGGHTPAYRVTPSNAGAEINNDCPCGCVAGFAFNRALAEQEPESCCCGRTMLVGRHAVNRLQAHLHGVGHFAFDVQTVTMPWGQPIEAALAIPAEPGH